MGKLDFTEIRECLNDIVHRHRVRLNYFEESSWFKVAESAALRNFDMKVSKSGME